MLTLEELRRQTESAEDIHSITRAMNALAAVRIRQARQAVESLEDYSRAVELALSVAFRNRLRGMRLSGEESRPGTGAVVFGSDLGLIGRLNIRITDFTLERLDDLRGRFNQQRKQQITEELMDLVTGFLAIEEEEQGPEWPQDRDDHRDHPLPLPSR